MINKLTSPLTGPALVVIGIGNEFRGDDGVGIYVATRLKEINLTGILVIEQSGEGTSLLESFKGHDNIIIVDAAQSGTHPGTIHIIEINKQPLPRDLFRGGFSHAFGLAEAIELGKNLSQLPQRLQIYGIEARSFELGEQMSDEVKNGAEQVIEFIIQGVS